MFSLTGISNTWTRPDKQLIFFLQPEYLFTLNSEIPQRTDSQSRKFQNYERLMRKPCFPRLFLLSPHWNYQGWRPLDIASFRLQDSPITALIRPFSLNDTICFQSGKMLFDGFRCDPYDFSEFPCGIVGMFLEDLDDPLPTFLLFLPTICGFSCYFL